MSEFDQPQSSSDRPDPEVTAVVAEAVGKLESLDALPTAHHVEVFESVHEVLSQTLSAVDEA